jgi:hypothetical protein
VNLDQDTGAWTLFDQAGNTFYTPPANPFAQTLDAWNADPTWGPILFGAGAKVTSVQYGLGSGQAVAVGFLDYLDTSLLNGGDVIDFQAAAVPEAGSFLAWSVVALSVGGALKLRRRFR